MSKSTYELEWERQRARKDLPPKHLPVHRWYLRMDEPWKVASAEPPQDGLTMTRSEKPGVDFYRFLYHTAGEEFVWGDRRRMDDSRLLSIVNHSDVHVMVLYKAGTPAGFFELDLRNSEHSEIKYFALLPGFLGGGLGGYMLNQAIVSVGRRPVPLILDTCTLDHFSALENYRKRGFEIYREEDEEYPDPRLDGTIPRGAGKHAPLAE